jgi:hypothetical protein
LCLAKGEPKNDISNTQKCLVGKTEPSGDGNTNLTAEEGEAGNSATESPIYRITVRVTGSKNAQSYTQAYVF